MAPGAVYVMMLIWAGIYFGIGALFGNWPENFITDIILFATHHVATGPQLVADPNYNVTIEEVIAVFVENYGKVPSEALLNRDWFYVPFYTNSLDYMSYEGITIMKVVNGMGSAINKYDSIVWAWFCGIGCFLGLMSIFSERKANGDHGIVEFDI